MIVFQFRSGVTGYFEPTNPSPEIMQLTNLSSAIEMLLDGLGLEHSSRPDVQTPDAAITRANGDVVELNIFGHICFESADGSRLYNNDIDFSELPDLLASFCRSEPLKFEFTETILTTPARARFLLRRAPSGLHDLHRAAYSNDVDWAKDELQNGASIDCRNSHGETPLHCAIYAEWLEVSEFLLANGADPNAKDKSGSTPKDYFDDGAGYLSQDEFEELRALFDPNS